MYTCTHSYQNIILANNQSYKRTFILLALLICSLGGVGFHRHNMESSPPVTVVSVSTWWCKQRTSLWWPLPLGAAGSEVAVGISLSRVQLSLRPLSIIIWRRFPLKQRRCVCRGDKITYMYIVEYTKLSD